MTTAPPLPGESAQRARGVWDACVDAVGRAGLIAAVAGVIWFYGRGGTVAATDNAYVKQDRIDVSARIVG